MACKDGFKKYLSILFLFLIQSMYCWSQIKDDKKDKDIEVPDDLSEKVEPILVNIVCDQGRVNGSGSVVGITKDRKALILTACHVVSKNFEDKKKDSDLKLKFYERIAVKIGQDSVYTPAGLALKYSKHSKANDDTVSLYNFDNDLALLITKKPVSLDLVTKYNKSDKVKNLQTVAAFGFPKYPDAQKFTSTVGQVKRIEKNLIVFNAIIEPGNSGGPLVDTAGRMVGMAIFFEETKKEKEGYAVPMNLIVAIVQDWFRGLQLKKELEYQKYTSFFKSPWPYIGGLALIGGSVSGYYFGFIANKDEGFPNPPGRPNGN